MRLWGLAQNIDKKGGTAANSSYGAFASVMPLGYWFFHGHEKQKHMVEIKEE
jgi:hypothetical protein